jgi:hypothetical protein
LSFATAEQVEHAKLSEGAKEAAAEICALRRQVDEQKQVASGLQQRLQDAQDLTEKQRVKLAEAEKARAVRKGERQKCSADLEKAQAKHTALLDQVQRNREGSAVSEYLQIKQNSKNSGADALSFLTKMASASLDPAPLLVEVTRLRDYHRSNLAKLQKEHVRMSQLESRNRREIAEMQRGIADNKKKLQRCSALSGSSGETLDIAPQAEKRARHAT